jgi:hypothetical protein
MDRNHGASAAALPMPEWLFKRFVGTDLITMWRRLRTGQVDVDPLETQDILPTPLTRCFHVLTS